MARRRRSGAPNFAAWAWREAGVRLAYGYGPGQLNGRAASFYVWGVTRGRWHPVRSGYRPEAGDVAVYGLRLGTFPWAAHVAIVTGDPRGGRGPDVVNGDGDRSGFSTVETGRDQLRADRGPQQRSSAGGLCKPVSGWPEGQGV